MQQGQLMKEQQTPETNPRFRLARHTKQREATLHAQL
jgi:hypothetical protein